MVVKTDVLLVTDARLPGGTSASIAEEVRAQAAAGYRTTLLQVDSPLVSLPRPLAPRVRACIERGELEVLTGEHAGAEGVVEAQLVAVRHPTVAATLDAAHLPRIRAAERLVIANQAPSPPASATVLTGSAPAGTHATAPRYEPHEVAETLEAWLGGAVRWAPIGPLVREDLARVAPDLALEPEDWVNVIDLAAWNQPRNRPPGRIPVIGRHSRDDPLKWPATREELLAAYPARDDVEVRILGGASGAARVLGGRVPENWRVWPFGAIPPHRFLAGLEIYVYQHHPAWVEAFGRSILEALASGLPTVLPPRFAPLFEDAACYAEPLGVAEVVASLHGDRDRYREVSARATGFVAERFGHAVHRRRLAALAEPTGVPTPRAPITSGPRGAAAERARSVPGEPGPETTAPERGRRVLFVSSNGAGVGHLMRLMAYARHAPADIDPLFLTFSQGAQVVADAGYPVEYLASRGITGADPATWHRFVRERVGELIERYDIEALVFDGTWPYRGLLDAAEDHPHVLLVWSRRAMWRVGVTNRVLEEERDRFDLVLEPGELAEDDDLGATRRYRAEAKRVGPVTALDLDDMEEPAAARAALGLDPERPAALVALGAGNIDDTNSVLAQVIAHLAREPDLQVRVTRSIISARETTLPDNVEPLSIYPLARYLRAFDLAVAASGYNSFHELTLAAVPTVFVPNQVTATDDQAARSRYADRIGIGIDLASPTPTAIDAALERVLDPQVRRRMHERAVARRRPGGAADAMAAIATALEEGPTGHVASAGEPSRNAPSKGRATTGRDPARPGAAAPSDATGPARPSVPARAPLRLPRREELRALPRRLRSGLRPRRLLSRTFAALPSPMRQLVRRVFALLPDRVRHGIRRRLRGLSWRGGGQPGSAVRLPVPAGTATVLDADSEDTLTVAIVVPSLGDTALVERVVERTAQLQAARGGFVPLFVLGDLAFRAARRHDYLVEHLPPRERDEALPQTVSWEEARRQRLASIVRWYRPDRLVTLPAPTDGDPGELFAVLAAALEGLDRPTD